MNGPCPWKEGEEKDFIKTPRASSIIYNWALGPENNFRSDDGIYDFIAYLQDRDNYEFFSESEQMDFESFRIDLLVWMKFMKNPKRNDICIWCMDKEDEFIKTPTPEGTSVIYRYLNEGNFNSNYKKEDFVSYIQEKEGFVCKTDSEKKDFDMYHEELLDWMGEKYDEQYRLLAD